MILIHIFYVLQDEDTYLIWAISGTDSPDLIYHGSGDNGLRGSYKINIINPILPTQSPIPESTTTTIPETTTVDPVQNIQCDYQEVLVHAFPAPCYVEFLCFNLGNDTIIVNSCEFINLNPRLLNNLSNSQITAQTVNCDFKEILVHAFPSPCRVEILCYNFTASIEINSCEFIDL